MNTPVPELGKAVCAGRVSSKPLTVTLLEQPAIAIIVMNPDTAITGFIAHGADQKKGAQLDALLAYQKPKSS